MDESKMKPIAMRCNEAQFNEIKQILIDNLLTVSSISPFDVDCILVNNRYGTLGMVTNYENSYINNDHNREYFDKWDKDTFLKYCGIEVKTENNMKTIITAQELLEIHKIACDVWKQEIKNYFEKLDINQNIEFTQDEIDIMFKAATKSQLPTLEKIFGKQVKPIEFNRIKTGSQVMIKNTGKHCGGFESIDESKPVEVIFFKTPYLLNQLGKFLSTGYHKYYTTFHQEGKFVFFNAESDINYITEVVQY